MTATDELRKLLDERSVEYEKATFVLDFTAQRSNETSWIYDDCRCEFTEFPAGSTQLVVYELTPEQAIAATLGRGECEIETTENWLPAEMYHRCKHCGAFFAVMNASGDIPPCVCPNCGRTVKR